MAEEKKDEPVQPVKKDESNIKSKRIKLCCCLGGCALLILLVIIIGSSTFLRTYFSTRGDTAIDRVLTGSPSPTATATPQKTKTPASSPPTAENFPAPGTCQPQELTSAAPMSIDLADPGLKQDIDVLYYQIYGSTENDLAEQMRQCGPKSEGEGYDAYASWYINWKYNYQMSGGACRVGQATVGVKVDVHYPKWETPADFQSGLDRKWQSFMANLETHENGHKQNGLDAASEVYNTISDLTGPSCANMIDLVNSTSQDIVAIYAQRDKDYDATTNHGATQGAIFP